MGLTSCTREISVIEAQVDGRSVVIIDTPGIDDTRAGVNEANIVKGVIDKLALM